MRTKRLTSAIVLVLVTLMALPRGAHAQATVGPGIWRAFADRIQPGTTLKIRLIDGKRFKATLLQVSPEGMTVQAKTRVPVPPQMVSFAEVASLEVDTGKGASMAKAVAIGAGVAAGAFFGLMAIMFAIWGD